MVWGRLTDFLARLGILADGLAYAGTLILGCYQSRKHITPQARSARSPLMPQEEWRVTIPGPSSPGYITGDQFLANRQRLAREPLGTNCEVPGGQARRGGAACSRVLVCGICAAGAYQRALYRARFIGRTFGAPVASRSVADTPGCHVARRTARCTPLPGASSQRLLRDPLQLVLKALTSL